MKYWSAICLLLCFSATSTGEAAEEPGADPKVEKGGKGGPGDSGKGEASAVKERPTPKLKSPQASEKLQEGLSQIAAREYAKARTTLNGVVKDAATPEDRKLLNALIDDTKLGSELEEARAMAERKDERKAITKVEKAIKAYPGSALRPLAEKFIQETEEVIYLVLDDFEPGSSLEVHSQTAKDPVKLEDKSASSLAANRWRKNQSFNSDPRYVQHGKGSMKWKVGGDYWGYSYRYWYEGYGYQSLELKNPISKWRYLSFWIFAPEADDGSLRVTMAPELEMGVLGSLYTKKFIDLRGKRGWIPVRLDLRNDFGNTANVKLEDIKFIRFDYLNAKIRTIYMDWVHLE